MAEGESGAGNRFRVRVSTAIALVAVAALGVGTSVASAEPLAMSFTEARANVGVQLSDSALFEAPDTAPFEAQIDPGTGSIAAGVLEVPQFATFITEPIEANVTVDFEIGVITGSFTQATGALTLEGEAGGTLTSEGKECLVSTDPAVLTLTTAGNSGGASPRSGAPFSAGLAGDGAIAGQWTDMHAAPVGGDTTFCEDVEGRIEGPGGIWLEQEDLVPPSPPQLTSTDPASPSQSGTPRILGTAETGSTVRVYEGAACAGTPIATGSAAELSSPGIAVIVDQGMAAFSATATDAAGNASACSAPIFYTFFIHGDPPAPPGCFVPKLVGKTLPRAKAALRNAGCELGEVWRQKQRKGKRRRPFVVKSSNPVAGTRTAGKVNLRLGPKPGKPRH